jgi:hypothetical protein
MGARLLPLLQVYIRVITLFLFRSALPGLVSLLGVRPISLLTRIVRGRLSRIFFVGRLFLCAHRFKVQLVNGHVPIVTGLFRPPVA